LRRMTSTEREANYWFWRGVGERMNLTIIPPTAQAALRFKEDYEAQSLRRTRAGVALTRELFALIESWLPLPLRPAVRPVVTSLLEPPFLAYFDLPEPNPRLRKAVRLLLKARSRAARWVPSRSEPRFFMDGAVKSYPAGYRPDQLGPPEAWRRRPRHDATRRNGGSAETDPRFCHHSVPPAERAASS